MDELFCGLTRDEVRKAYFGGKLKAMIAGIQASGEFMEQDWKNLYTVLEILRLEDEAKLKMFKKGFASELGMDDIKPPSVDELVGEDKTLDSWIKDKEEVLADVRAKMKAMRTKLGDKNFDIKQLQDLAFELAFWRNWIVQDTIYKRQLWKQKLTRLIDDYEISRREAEDRSELTKEYRDYVLAFEFQKSVEDLIVSARKGYTE